MNYIVKQAVLNKIAKVKKAINFILRKQYRTKLAFTPYGEYDPNDLPKKKPWPSKDNFDKTFGERMEKANPTPTPGTPIKGTGQFNPTIDSIKKYRRMYPWATPTNYFFQPSRKLSLEEQMALPAEHREHINKYWPGYILPPQNLTLMEHQDDIPPEVKKVLGIYTGSDLTLNDHEKGHWYAEKLLSIPARIRLNERYNPYSGTFNESVYEKEYPAVAQQLDTAIRQTGKPIINDAIYLRREYMPANYMGNMPVGAEIFGTTEKDPVRAWTPGLDGNINKSDTKFNGFYRNHEKENYPELAAENDNIEQGLQEELDAIDPKLKKDEQIERRFEALMKIHPSLYNIARRGNLNAFMRANNDFNDPKNNYQKRKEIADAYSYLRENFEGYNSDGIEKPRMNPRLWRVIQKYQVEPDLDTNKPRNILPLDQLNNMKNEVDFIQKTSPHLDTTHGFLPTA